MISATTNAEWEARWQERSLPIPEFRPTEGTRSFHVICECGRQCLVQGYTRHRAISHKDAPA